MTIDPTRDDEHPVPAPAPQPDGRQLWEWKTKYDDALPHIRREAKLLGGYLFVFGVFTILAFGAVGDVKFGGAAGGDASVFLRRRDILVFLVGSLGGTVFSIKWLVHSVANGLWHQDRFLWRLFVPLTGGIYALVVLALIQSGFIGGGAGEQAVLPSNLMRDTVVAFLAGYFADGVSGLLTNVANAIFGKIDKK